MFIQFNISILLVSPYQYSPLKGHDCMFPMASHKLNLGSILILTIPSVFISSICVQ